MANSDAWLSVLSRMKPANVDIIMPPMPITDATAARGKISNGKV